VVHIPPPLTRLRCRRQSRKAGKRGPRITRIEPNHSIDPIRNPGAHGTHGIHGIDPYGDAAPITQTRGPRITRIEPNHSVGSDPQSLVSHGTHGIHGVGQRASQAPSIQIKGPRITRIEPNRSIGSNPQSWGPRNTRNTRSRPTSLPSPEHSNQGPANYSNRAESFDRIQSAILEAHGTHGTHGVGQRASQAPSIQIKGPRITRIEPNASIPSSSGCCRFPGPLVPTIRAHSRNSRAPLAFFRVFRVFRGRSPGIGF